MSSLIFNILCVFFKSRFSLRKLHITQNVFSALVVNSGIPKESKFSLLKQFILKVFDFVFILHVFLFEALDFCVIESNSIALSISFIFSSIILDFSFNVLRSVWGLFSNLSKSEKRSNIYSSFCSLFSTLSTLQIISSCEVIVSVILSASNTWLFWFTFVTYCKYLGVWTWALFPPGEDISPSKLNLVLHLWRWAINLTHGHNILKFRRKHYGSETRTSSLAYGRPSLRFSFNFQRWIVIQWLNILRLGYLNSYYFPTSPWEKALNERASSDNDILIASL